MVKARRTVAVGIVSMITWAVVGAAQAGDTGTLIVKTQDKAGAAFPGIVIEVKNAKSLSAPFTKHSDASGSASFVLTAGAGYTARVSGGGMEEQVSEEFKIEPGKTRTMVFTMSPGIVEKVLVKSKAVDAAGYSVLALRSRASGRVASPEWRRGSRAGSGNEAKVLREVAGPNPGDGNTEGYARIVENPFLAVAPNPLSTFSVDVDRASYSNVRRFIDEGRLPPRDAVRIEELINYFAYDYPEPDGKDPFSVTTEVCEAPWNPKHSLVRIGLKGRSVDMKDMPPGNLVFLIDVSGSMDQPVKLPLLKSSLVLLVDQLRPQDRVAIVVYAGNAGLVLPSTTGSDKGRIMDALNRLEAGGSTAGGAGIQLAYKVAAENHIEGGNNRVILATDGDFNVGVSSDAEMVRLIEEKRQQGTFLTVLGFGEGNLQDAKMEQIADKGNGHYAYIDSLMEARKVLVGELGGTLLTIAKDVKIQVEFNPAKVAAYRLIGYENRLLRNEDFNDDAKDAGDIGAGHTVTALYEIVPVGAEEDLKLAPVDPLRYGKDTEANASVAGKRVTPATTGGSKVPKEGHGDELLFVKLRYKDPDGTTSRLVEGSVLDAMQTPSVDFRFAAAVAEFGLLLHDSEYKGTASWDDVIAAATRASGRDEAGYRKDFLRLAGSARTLAVREVVSATRD